MLDTGPDLIGRNADIFRAEADVLLDYRSDDLVVGILEDHAGLLTDRKLVLRQLRVLAVDVDCSFSRDQQRVDVLR